MYSCLSYTEYVAFLDSVRIALGYCMLASTHEAHTGPSSSGVILGWQRHRHLNRHRIAFYDAWIHVLLRYCLCQRNLTISMRRIEV